MLAALVDERGAIQYRISRPTDPYAGTTSIIGVLEELLTQHQGGVSAIGLGVAGYVEQPSGRVVFAPNLIYGEVDIRHAVAARFGLPVLVDNDANVAAWAERQYGAGRRADEMLMVTVGTGIGGGIVAGGKLYRGSRGFAGEFGHMTILEGGPQCSCGQHGCVEALGSGTAIARMAREGIGSANDSILLELAGENPSRITGALVTEAARADDPFAIDVLGRAGWALGVCFANLTNLFDPQMIVVGGSVADAGYFLLEPARLELVRRVADRREPPVIATASLGGDAGVIGAAALATSASTS